MEWSDPTTGCHAARNRSGTCGARPSDIRKDEFHESLFKEGGAVWGIAVGFAEHLRIRFRRAVLPGPPKNKREFRHAPEPARVSFTQAPLLRRSARFQGRARRKRGLIVRTNPFVSRQKLPTNSSGVSRYAADVGRYAAPVAHKSPIVARDDAVVRRTQIGRASCRERV